MSGSFHFDPQGYGTSFAEVLQERRLNPLDGGQPNTTAYAALKQLTVERAFAGKTVVDNDMASACLSAVWLYHNYLDESHTLSQGIHTATGSYWHGIMHRREPDFWNSKYWFRRVGIHPVFDLLRPAAVELAGTGEADPGTEFLRTQTAWDPYAFIDLCEAALAGRSPAEQLCRQIQAREWDLLFDFSFRRAIGSD